jgi:hypothetical protein
VFFEKDNIDESKLKIGEIAVGTSNGGRPRIYIPTPGGVQHVDFSPPGFTPNIMPYYGGIESASLDGYDGYWYVNKSGFVRVQAGFQDSEPFLGVSVFIDDVLIDSSMPGYDPIVYFPLYTKVFPVLAGNRISVFSPGSDSVMVQFIPPVQTEFYFPPLIDK